MILFYFHFFLWLTVAYAPHTHIHKETVVDFSFTTCACVAETASTTRRWWERSMVLAKGKNLKEMCLCLTANVAFMCTYTMAFVYFGHRRISCGAWKTWKKKTSQTQIQYKIIINYVFRWTTKNELTHWEAMEGERRWRSFHIDFSKGWISDGRLTSSNLVIALDLCHFFSVNDVIFEITSMTQSSLSIWDFGIRIQHKHWQIVTKN